MVLRTITFTSLLLVSGLQAMDCLPSDIIKKIAKTVVNSHWTDEQRAFGLQSMATLNRHWNIAMGGLPAADFPYLAE
jgi:hypothetical protein